MYYHRILSVPAEQITHGDVIIVYKNVEYNWKSFTALGPGNEVSREGVIGHHRDPADGTIYIETETYTAYVAASSQIQLDCLKTFGRNVKPV